MITKKSRKFPKRNVSIFEQVQSIDWADDSPPNLVDIGMKLAELEQTFISEGLSLPEGYLGAEAIMDMAMLDELPFDSISGILQKYVELLVGMQNGLQEEKLMEVYLPLLEILNAPQKSKGGSDEISEDGGNLFLEFQNDEDLDSLRSFNSESVENIDNLDDNLPSLVKRSDDITLLNNLFRGYHTIKGAAGFFGLDDIASVTHEMENVLDRARQGKLRIDDEVVSLMSRGNAWIKKHFQRLDSLLKDVGAPFEVSMNIDNFAPIIYGCKAILSRSEETIEMVENTEEGSDKDSSIRISSEYLDQFLDEVGGLINLAHIFNHSIAILERAKIDRNDIQMFKDNFSVLEDRSESLQKNLMMLRRIKLETIFKKIPKIVYKLGQVVGKQVEVECIGGDVEIDRSMLDNLEEPLVHILRNSMDHGFEENDERVALDKPHAGKLKLQAEDQGSLIHLEISDDGRGINGDIIAKLAMEKGLLTQEQVESMSFQKKQELIFMAGFSTKEQTSEISGRGVGMDVVKNKILETGGSFDLKSELGQGTTIMIDLPKSATLATRSILRVRVQNSWFGLPMDKIEYLSVMDADKRLPLVEKNVEVFPYRDQMLPIISLENIFSIEKNKERKERCFIIMRMDKFKYVIEVDELDEFEIQVIQDLLEGHFEAGPFEGASVLGDGSICLMLAMEKILNLAQIKLEQGEAAKASVAGLAQSSYELTNTLVFQPSLDNLTLSIDMSSVFRIDNYKAESLSVIKRKKAYNSKLGLLQYYEFSDFGIGLPLHENEDPESILIINICGRPLAFGVSKIIDMHSGAIQYKGKLNIPGLYQSWSYKDKLVGAVDLNYIESFFRKSLISKKTARLTG